MGDRCSCTLRIAGVLKHEHIPLLAKAMDNAGVDGRQNEDLLKEGKDFFDFYEVNYGSMDQHLQKTLFSLKLSFCWNNDFGDEYGPADLYYDARTGKMAEYSLSNNSICLTLRQIEQDGVLEEAKKWQEFSRTMKLCVAESNHDLVAKVASDQSLRGYLDLVHHIQPEAA
jgi:hypothetical protein